MKKPSNGNFYFTIIIIILFLLIFLNSLDKSLQIDSNFAYAWNNKGLALNNLGKYEKAIEWQFLFYYYYFYLIFINISQ